MQCVAQRADAQLTFRLPKKIAGDLSRIAARRGLQRSELLRQVVEEIVAQESQSSRHFESVKDLIGAANTGESDLGSDHRRHLKNGFGRAR
jgi:metal-responsive CopG/Arc/MetJ family transcriptional regulator